MKPVEQQLEISCFCIFLQMKMKSKGLDHVLLRVRELAPSFLFFFFFIFKQTKTRIINNNLKYYKNAKNNA